MAVLSPATINQRVQIQGYKTKEGRNCFSPEQLIKNQVVSNTREFNMYWDEYKEHDPPLAFAFILHAWKHTLEHHRTGALFSPVDAKNFLVDPIAFLSIINYPWDKVSKGVYNPFNRTKKWPE